MDSISSTINFDYVKREFLGEVRCLVFDVTPLPKSGKGRFLGRIWVEDQDYHIVRFNGGYGGAGKTAYYFHFDSWRTNLQPGLWLPSFVYSEEKELHYAMTKKLDFRAQTRLWGYNIGKAQQEQELSKILVETPVNRRYEDGERLDASAGATLVGSRSRRTTFRIVCSGWIDVAEG